MSQARSKKSRLFGAGFIWTKKTQITFLLFRLCLSRRCGSIARVNTRNRANARALESFLVVPSVLSTSPTCRIERALSDSPWQTRPGRLRTRLEERGARLELLDDHAGGREHGEAAVLELLGLHLLERLGVLGLEAEGIEVLRAKPPG